MSAIQLGDVAPPLRLPSGQGPEIGTDDYRGRKKLIVWFTKGFGCAFCRTHMAQMVRMYPEIRDRDAEILEVTISRPEQARLYLKKFSLPFPYLCDPEYRARTSWGLSARSQPLSRYVQNMFWGIRNNPASDFGPPDRPPLAELPRLLADDDMGFFVLDRTGVVRFSASGAYGDPTGVRPIPTPDEILRALDACA